MSSLDNFFKKRLSDYSPAEDEWNIPSEDLWDNASKEFPKKKRNYWSFLLPIAFIGLGVGLWLMNADSKAPSSQEWAQNNTTDVPERGSIVIENKKEVFSGNREIKSVENIQLHDEIIASEEKESDKNYSASTVASPVKSNTHFSQELASEAEVEKQLIQPQKDVEVKPTLGESRVDVSIQQEEEVVREESFVALTQSSTIDLTSRQNATEFEQSFPMESKAIDLQEDGNFSDSSLKDIEKAKAANVNLIEVREEAPAMNSNAAILNPLVSLSFLSLSKQNVSGMKIPVQSVNQNVFPKKFKTQVKYLRGPAREIGLSSQVMLLDFFEGWQSGETARDSVKLGTQFDVLNMEYRHWLGRNWSISTGLGIMESQIDLEFSVFENITSDDVDAFVQDGYVGVLEKNTPASNYDVEPIDFLEGEYLIPGEVNVRGFAMIDIQVIRVPLLINRHWYKKRFEFILGAGLSFNRMVSVDLASNLSLYQGDVLLNEPFTDQGTKETAVAILFELQSGIRYHLGKRFNVGLNTSITANDLFFSGIGMGLYYRWRK